MEFVFDSFRHNYLQPNYKPHFAQANHRSITILCITFRSRFGISGWALQKKQGLSNLVISPSWNFPAQAELWTFRAWAEPSCGTLIFELKPSWTKNFLTRFSPSFYYQKSCIMILINFMIIYLNIVFSKVNNLI